MEEEHTKEEAADPHTACVASIAACEAKFGELEGKWKRALADLANEEKANARAREEFAKYAAASVLRDLLPIMDAVEAGIQSSTSLRKGSRGDEESKLLCFPRGETGEAMSSPRDRRALGELEGERQPGTSNLDAIAKLLHDLLTHHGVARIPCDGKPDYTLHEIISTRAVEGVEPGVIVEVVQQGYTMHGQCLRPARVMVAE